MKISKPKKISPGSLAEKLQSDLSKIYLDSCVVKCLQTNRRIFVEELLLRKNIFYTRKKFWGPRSLF